MMRSRLRRALVAVALGLGVTAGLARADGQPPSPGPVIEADGAVPPGAFPADSAVPPGAVPMDGAVPPGAVPTDGVPCAPPKHKLLRCLRPRNVVQAVHNHPPVGCYSNFNDYSCTNLRTELLWVFGSCRQFFGERCLKGPPPSPVPGFNPQTLTYSPPGTYPPTVVQPPCKCR